MNRPVKSFAYFSNDWRWKIPHIIVKIFAFRVIDYYICTYKIGIFRSANRLVAYSVWFLSPAVHMPWNVIWAIARLLGKNMADYKLTRERLINFLSGKGMIWQCSNMKAVIKSCHTVMIAWDNENSDRHYFKKSEIYTAVLCRLKITAIWLIKDNYNNLWMGNNF